MSPLARNTENFLDICNYEDNRRENQGRTEKARHIFDEPRLPDNDPCHRHGVTGKARKEAASLDKVTVIETSRYGQKVSPHPVFKVMRDAEASITRQLKALGLTTIDVMENGTPQDDDPMVKLMNQLSD